MKKIIMACFLSVLCFQGFALTGFDADYNAALKRAKDNSKPIFILFTGSDWCSWCVKFEKEVLSKSEFLDYATNTWELVVADFPQKKKIAPELKKQYQALQKKYAVRGFPTVMLIDAKGKELCSAGYSKGGAKVWLEKFLNKLKITPLVEQYLAPIEKKVRAIGEESRDEITANVKTLEPTDYKKWLQEYKSIANKYLPKVKAISDELAKLNVPDEILEKKEELSEEVNFMMVSFESAAKMDVEKEAKRIEELRKESESTKKVERKINRVTIPKAGEGKVDSEYFAKVAMPFYKKHIVDTFVPTKKMDKKTADDVRKVRWALARYLSTGRLEFPTGEECALAEKLWRKKFRDPAVAMLFYHSLFSDAQYWRGRRIFSDAIKIHNFKREPIFGFILKSYLCKAEKHRLKVRKSDPVKPYQDACAELEKYTTDKIVDVFKKADYRILERLEELIIIPPSLSKKVGNEYLSRCMIAERAMNAAFEARGSGWASDVTEEGWKGFQDNNEIAASNLLAAVKLRPEGARAPMMLARLSGSSCAVSEADTYSWCSLAVSNSLDECAEQIQHFVHFRTSRWGGSTAFLRDFLMQCATNVDVRSTFSYAAAAAAFRKILVAEADNSVQSNALERFITPDMRAALYGMFDAYAAAPETEFMPSADMFRGMGMSLALQFCDWPKVRKYYKMIKKPLKHHVDSTWLIRTYAPAINNTHVSYLFRVLGQSKYAEQFLEAEEAVAAKDYEKAYKLYSKLQNIEKPSDGEKYIAAEGYYTMRRVIEEKKGGWVNLMPSKTGGEAIHFWGMTFLDDDGKARCHDNTRSYYRVKKPIPGIGSEFEGTIHFEKDDKNRKVWNIGWGLARVYSGFCADNNSWAYPYIAFTRDEKGDHYAIETYTNENSNRENFKDEDKWVQLGRAPYLMVAQGDLEKSDSHSFKLSTTEDKIEIFIDGKIVYSSMLDDIINVSYMRDRIQPNGDVLPVWKVFTGSSFSDYRYRRLVK